MLFGPAVPLVPDGVLPSAPASPDLGAVADGLGPAALNPMLPVSGPLRCGGGAGFGGDGGWGAAAFGGVADVGGGLG